MRRWTGVAFAGTLLGCQSLDRFDTKSGAAYCGSIESSQFIWTPPTQGGFDRRLRMRLELDTGAADVGGTGRPGKITTDDTDLGPCAPSSTFAATPLRVMPEVAHDSLSLMTFEDGQVRNIVAWVDSTCRGTMLAIVSLYSSDHVDVRLLKPGAASATNPQDAFALFPLDRREAGCGF